MAYALVTKWILKAMAAWVPTFAVPWETVADQEIRRESIAQDFVEVAFDPAETSLFAGSDGRAKTAIFLAAIASFESHYDKRVDTGKLVGQLKEICIMQVMVGWKSEEGWTQSDIMKDRKKCIRVALHMLHSSAKKCKEMGITEVPDIYSIYTSGKCFKGNWTMGHRYGRASKWVKDNPIPVE